MTEKTNPEETPETSETGDANTAPETSETCDSLAAESSAETIDAAPAVIPQEEIESGKVLAVLAYIIPILVIVPIIQRDNDFALFHARQVLLLLIAGVLVSVVNVIPCLGQIIFVVGALTLLVLGILGLINAIRGDAKPLPLIGGFAEEWFKGLTKNA